MIKRTKFGQYDQYTIESGSLSASFISYGARITKLIYSGKDVLLGYDSPEDYENGNYYIGATIGRYGNRIANGTFSLNGKTFQVERNENEITCLHGGFKGFDRCNWNGKIISDNALSFTRKSPDGECGFPGNVTVRITYTLEENALLIEYRAETDSDTVLNLTNHAYFNLDGFDGADCREMLMSLPAEHYLPVDKDLIPTGEIKEVAGTAFDFRVPRAIKEDFDHCFVYSERSEYRKAGFLYSPSSKIRMEIETDMPGIQLYTCSNFESCVGKGGVPLHKHQGAALETQFFPDSPNHSNFPSTVLKKGDIFESKTRYIFSKNDD